MGTRLEREGRLASSVVFVDELSAFDGDQLCGGLSSGGSSQDSSVLGAGSGAPSQPEHCAICHWTRLLRSPLTVVGISTTNVGPATLVLRGALPAHVDEVNEHLPARAPPALL